MSDSGLPFRPLYQQAREEFLNRLVDGRWAPGMLIPNEQSLAADLGVSPGTVRKALDAMAADRLLVRQQGRGTFVAVPEEAWLQFQFFRLVSDSRGRQSPESVVQGIDKVRATAADAAALRIPAKSRIWAIRRTRSLGGDPVISEVIKLEVARFPDLDRVPSLPNSLYALYLSRYGLRVVSASERISAVRARRADAFVFGGGVGDPLLLIQREAFALDGAVVEWRESLCRGDGYHYVSELK